jgi:HEAT repeat protein
LIQNSFLEVIKSTGYTAPLVLAKVIELLDWPYWQVRMRATETLGELRRNIPDPAIRRLLALRRDPDPLMKSVREAADDALAEILSLEDGIEDD